MSRVGDWYCRSCQHLNFQRREHCQRCGDVKGGGFGGSTLGFGTEPPVRPGDWYCDVCNFASHNFATRSTCFQCGAAKNTETSCSRPSWKPQWKYGDWICKRDAMNTTLLAECNVLNAYLQRTCPRNQIIHFWDASQGETKFCKISYKFFWV